MKLQLPALLAVGIFASACTNAKIGPQNALENLMTGGIAVTHETLFGLPPGFECPVVPHDMAPVASIYRREKNGSHYQVMHINADPNIEGKKKTYRIANYKLSDKQISSSNVSASLVKNALPGLSANAYANTNSSKAIGITVKDLIGESINDQVEDYIVDRFRKNMEPRDGSRYFIVRESIKAGSLSYVLEDKDVAKLGGKAQIEKIAEGKADVTVRDHNGSLEIEQKFNPRISVCTKSSEIAVHTAAPSSSARTARVASKPAAAQ